MGVPGFFRWIVQRYPMIRRKMADPSRPRINNLYIDMNGIFYKALAATGTRNEDLTPALLAEIFRYTDMLVQLIHPTDLIFIAVDGPAPNAKASQQRSRRFEAAKAASTNAFDRTQISPGTMFMEKLNQELLKYIQEKVKTDAIWSKNKVIYSNSFVPGEGEHKILDYIREGRSKEDWNPNLVHCMYSTDADLIFLGLQTHEPNMLLLREADAANFQRDMQPFEAKETKTNYSFESFELFYFSLLREYISLDFGCNPSTLERVIDDFIAISFLIGNDFIPAFADIDIKQGDFNPIVDEYKKFYDGGNKYIVEDGDFNRENLKEYLTKIVQIFMEKYRNEEKIEDDKELEEKYFEKNKKYLEERYEKKVEEDFESLCYDMACGILDAFHWVLKYYNSGCPSWSWSYPFLYAPPLQFVIPYVADYVPEFEEDAPNLPFIQQLCIFPPQSAHLMPEPLAKLMVEPSPLAKYYPTEFETDSNGRKSAWQAIVKLPLLEYDEINEEYQKVASEIDPEDMKRNRHDTPIEFFKGEQKAITITKGTTFLPKDLSTKSPDCTPTLYSLVFECETRVVPVKVFEFPSQSPSIVIKVKSSKEMTAKDALPLLGKQILMGYPYLRPALVVGAIDKDEYIDASGNLKKRPESVNFPNENREKFLLESRGLEIKVTCFLVVKPLVICSNDGLSLDFDSKTELFPTSTMLPINSTTVGLRYQEVKAEELHVDETVVLYKGTGKGCVGKISKINEESVDVVVTERDQPVISNIIREDVREWTTFNDITRKNGISFRALGMALSQVNVDGTNVALQLYTRNKRQVIDGYARIVDEKGNVEISLNAADLIPVYFQKAGNLKTLLNDHIKSGVKGPVHFTKSQLFPDDTDKKYQAFITWLTEHSPAATAPLVSSSTITLTPRATAAIEQVLDKYKMWSDETPLDHIPLSSLIRKSGARAQIPDQKLVLGSRVICVASSGSVPFGTYGTVIGIDSEARQVSVVFDKPLACGTKLDGKLKSNRGMRLMEREVFCI